MKQKITILDQTNHFTGDKYQQVNLTKNRKCHRKLQFSSDPFLLDSLGNSTPNKELYEQEIHFALNQTHSNNENNI